MTNFEKYKEAILDIANDGYNIAFETNKNAIVTCNSFRCVNCLFDSPKSDCRCNTIKWLYEEYKEPEVDWFTVPVDTKIYVRNKDVEPWRPRYFSHYDPFRYTVHTFSDGATSWSADTNPAARDVGWKYAKLAEESEK